MLATHFHLFIFILIFYEILVNYSKFGGKNMYIYFLKS